MMGQQMGPDRLQDANEAEHEHFSLYRLEHLGHCCTSPGYLDILTPKKVKATIYAKRRLV